MIHFALFALHLRQIRLGVGFDPMATSFDDVLISIWRQALVENADAVKVNGERYPATICAILSVTGMRIGEVLALRAQDLDFRRKQVCIRCSTYAGQIGTPKSKASIANVPMPRVLESRLKSYLASRHCRQNSLGLLFVNRRGRPYSANKLREKKLRPLLAELGIPLAGFHAFRHAVASEMIDSGAPITVVQAHLRHSDPRITLGLYGHVIPQSQRDAVEKLGARFESQLLTEAGIADSAA